MGMESIDRGSTKRTAGLLKKLRERASIDRSGEWFQRWMFPEIGKLYPKDPVILRRARAFDAMLKAMTNPENAVITRSYSIEEGELIVGNIPLGSVGLGKEFPRYMTVEERRLASITSRDEESMFGHNSPDYDRVLQKGLKDIISFSQERLKSLEIDLTHRLGPVDGLKKKKNFYEAVIICCKAVIDYAHSFSKLATQMAVEESNPTRKAELNRLAEICNKVPEHPADTFHEALQSIWFIHVALHSTLDLVSLGRLDQVLQPYYEESLRQGQITRGGAVELLECFLIKGAGRLNMTTAYLMKQDHLDFGTGLGTSPVFLDQVASANNFLQNIVLGGQTIQGGDATNECTYMILEASGNVGVPTPTIVVRLHAASPQSLMDKAADTLKRGGAGLPIIYNDDAIVPAFEKDGIPRVEALDYVVDGCWEPILNAKCDWTFGMVNLLTVLECALNRGSMLMKNPSLLRGQKKSYATKDISEMTSFDDLLKAVRFHIDFFTDMVGLGIYRFYTIDASVTPTPFFSALLGSCLLKGIDKTWGGSDYILGGILSTAAPNCANALLSIKKFVFEEKKYTLEQVVAALRNNYVGYEDMLNEFTKASKYGNSLDDVDSIMRWLMDEFYESVQGSKMLCDKIFLSRPDGDDAERIDALRNLAGYSGESMKERFGEDFTIYFTTGSGTFGQYASMGKGVAASADGRKANEPIAPNCSPVSGTAINGIGHIFSSMQKLNLNRFAAGVMTDICLDDKYSASDIAHILSKFVANGGNLMSVSSADVGMLKEIKTLCDEVRAGSKDPSVLNPYTWLSVRVGGWNAPFVTLTDEQQEDYLKRIMR